MQFPGNVNFIYASQEEVDKCYAEGRCKAIMKKGQGLQVIKDEGYVVVINGIHKEIMKTVIADVVKWTFGIFLPILSIFYLLSLLPYLLSTPRPSLSDLFKPPPLPRLLFLPLFTLLLLSLVFLILLLSFSLSSVLSHPSNNPSILSDLTPSPHNRLICLDSSLQGHVELSHQMAEYWEDAYGACRDRGPAVMVFRARRSAYLNRDGGRIQGEQIKFLRDRIN